jgi:dCTP diphosphatase
MSQVTLSDLRNRLREFTEARDWQQFHTPKNLAMALSVEVGELLEHFQWLSPQESNDLSDESLREVTFEIADVLTSSDWLTYSALTLRQACLKSWESTHRDTQQKRFAAVHGSRRSMSER